MKPFGICMAGCEERFEALLKEQATTAADTLFTYLEIGVAYAGTFKAVHDILVETGRAFEMIGIDPGDYGALEKAAKWPNVKMLKMTREDAFRRNLVSRMDFAFIDGCHSKKCVKEDFLAVEKLIKPGGIVVFHDFGIDSVGAGLPPHCLTEKTDVRGAAEELQLLPCTRPGWEMLGEWQGDKARQGFDCGVYRKL